MSREAIFVDTCCWIAIINKNDNLSQQARTSLQAALDGGAQLVTSDMVFVEALNRFARKGETWRRRAAEFIDDINAREDTLVVEQSHQQFVEAFNFYQKYTDKEWGLTDCACFVVMKEMGITKALTDDHHFEQANFVCLMKSEK